MIFVCLVLLCGYCMGQASLPSFRLFTTDDAYSRLVIYDSHTLSDLWNPAPEKEMTCQVSPKAIESSSKLSRRFYYEATCDHSQGNTTSSCPNAISNLTVSTGSQDLIPQISLNESNSSFEIKYNCLPASDSRDATFGMVRVVLGLSNGTEIQFSYLKICQDGDTKRLDISPLILMIVACLVVGFAARQDYFHFEGVEEEEQEVKPIYAVLFIVSGSAVLLLLFFFRPLMVLILSFFIIIISVFATSFSAGELLKFIPFIRSNWVQEQFNLPLCQLSKLDILSGLIAVVLVFSWVFTRIWILNDFLAISIAFLVIKSVKLSSLKVAALLLILAFGYDIFWVFISKPIFGDSVMAAVATSVDLPIKIEIPHILVQHPLSRCSLIGLGDLALPGFFICFCHKISEQIFRTSQQERSWNNRNRYYVIAMVGYVVGFSACLAALFILQMGQPALLYLVPCLLIPVSIVSAIRGEIKELWEGFRKETSDQQPIHNHPENSSQQPSLQV